jgi:hypothetical protein
MPLCSLFRDDDDDGGGDRRHRADEPSLHHAKNKT